MTSLLGRLVRLFPGSVPLEDLFTEAVARLFERRPELCVAWLEGAGLLSPPPAERSGDRYVRVASQKPFVPLRHHDTASRPDLIVEVRRSFGDVAENGGPVAHVVMVESKIGASEGQNQLRRYAEHLGRMESFGDKTLVYVTRAYDPKDPREILAGLGDDVRFEQLRWHGFYRFLQDAEKDALVEEVMLFMEEQGMARDYRFSAGDLVALSGMPRAFEIMDETLDGEVRAELESFAGGKSRRESLGNIRRLWRYVALAQLHGNDLFCFAGYHMDTDEYPWLAVDLQAQPGAVGREVSVAAMRKIALLEDWEAYNLDDSKDWAGVYRGTNLANLLHEEDHIAAAKRFLIESIRQLGEELAAFKKEHPDLPWESRA